jgi:hypothetical protein
MENTLVLVLATLAATMLGVSMHAWRLRNEKRDVAVLGALGGLLGAGTLFAAA